MRICLDVCRVLKKILIALCVFLLIVVPLITMYTTHDGPSPLKTFFQEVLYVLPLLPCLLMLLLPVIAAEQWLQTKIWDLSRTKLKRRLWILAICEIILLAIILTLMILGDQASHAVLTQIE